MWFLVFGGWSGELNLAVSFLFNSSLAIKKSDTVFMGIAFLIGVFWTRFLSERVLAFVWDNEGDASIGGGRIYSFL